MGSEACIVSIVFDHFLPAMFREKPAQAHMLTLVGFSLRFPEHVVRRGTEDLPASEMSSIEIGYCPIAHLKRTGMKCRAWTVHPVVWVSFPRQVFQESHMRRCP